MFKGLGNLASMLKQAQQMQGKMAEIQKRLDELVVEGEAGGGMVCVRMTGQQKVLGVRFDPGLLTDPDAELLEELTTAAINQALERAKAAAANEMSQLAGGMDVPNLADAMENLGIDPAGDGT